MREATFSLTRVAVLALLTCSFAVVWSNDRQAQSAFVLARRENWRPASAAPVEVADLAAAPRKHLRQIHHRLARSVRVEMPLPAGITSGRYQIIEPTGRMSGMIITIDGGSASAVDRDLYSLEVTGQGRRYFIRVPMEESGRPFRGAAMGTLPDRR